MMLRIAAFIGVILALVAPTPLLGIDTVTELTLAIGRDEDNKLPAAVIDSSNAAALRIEPFAAAYNAGAKIVRRLSGGFFTKGPEYNLARTVNLAALLTEAFRTEAAAMGFKTPSAEGPGDGWVVSGTLKDIFMLSQQIPYGPTLFYGYMGVELQISRTGEAPIVQSLRLHSYYYSTNAGIGRKDEAMEGLAHLLVEGAQEALCRLNRLHFKAPPAPVIESKVAALSAESNRLDARIIGLSGYTAAVPALLKAATQVKYEDEEVRAAMIEAIGNLGSQDAVKELVDKYDSLDEDGRWATLKALDYIGGDPAAAAITEKGLKDDDDRCSSMAERIGGTSKGGS